MVLSATKQTQNVVAHFLIDMKAIVLGLLTTFLLGDTADVTQIKLNYYRTEDNQVWNNGIDELTVKTKGRVIEKILTDKNGLGTIKKDTIKKYKEIDIFLTSIGIEELYLQTIDNSTIDRWEINIPRYYKMKLGRAVCPKCNKTDKVYKAIYGDGQILTLKINDKGDTTYSNISGRNYYMGTCVTNDLNPLWHCERDKIEF